MKILYLKTIFYKYSKMSLNEIIDYINVKHHEVDNLPVGINISTMCATCKINTKINIDNIEKYLPLNINNILTVKKDVSSIRTLLNIKQKKKRELTSIQKMRLILKNKDATKNHFYNQITIVNCVNDNIDNIENIKKINMKLFKNGSIQMSGCKSVEYINIALNKLFFKLKEVKAVIENNKIIKKPFVENTNIMVHDFKINMINSNYKVNMHIDREKLYSLLIKKKINVTYEPCIRACIIIKYTPLIDNKEEKKISIFIFQKGNIIITGARSKSHIIESYNYINDILLNHTNEIIKNTEEYEENVIFNIYSDFLKDINAGIITC